MSGRPWIRLALGGLWLTGFTASHSSTTQWLVEPGAGVSPWVQAIERAHQQIDVNAYVLTDDSVLDALNAAAARGVAIRLILEAHPYRMAWAPRFTRNQLVGSGIATHAAPARFDRAYAFDHAKYMVVDPGQSDQVAILGSANGTDSAVDGHNLEDDLETT